MTERVTVLGVGGGEAVGLEGLAALAEAEFVHATRAELAAVRGLVPPGAVVDVLGDTAMEDPEGHRWDLPREPATVVVLTPPGDLVWRVVRAIGEHVGPQRVRAIAPGPAAGLVVEPEAGPLPSPPRALGWALPGELWSATEPLPAAVRALVLAWLGPGEGDLVWDLARGAGGAVGVEAARLGAAAVVVQPDDEGGRRAREDAARRRVEVTVVAGGGSAALAALPDPDAVFAAGPVEELVAELAVAAQRRPRALVAALPSDGDAELARRALEGAGLVVEGEAVTAQRLGETTASRWVVLRGTPDG